MIEQSPYREFRSDEPVQAPPVRRRRKTLRHHFCDGIEAAVKAEPEAFIATRPRTMLGLMVRELVRGAGRGRCDQIRLVVFFLDEGARRRTEAEIAMGGNSQGNSELPQPKWEWKEDGSWDSSERETPDNEDTEAKEAQTQALREKLKDMILRAAEGDRLNAERKARIAAEQTGRTPISESNAIQFSGIIADDASDSPNSGNIAPPDGTGPVAQSGGRPTEG
ncbi:MAG TPA: hypothetical protein VHU23_05995 [Rhizomicrobium sp.]|jgi:hypothetical protein|nr:hypothetical protein [Rhizomicrobium sp.]